MLIKDMFEKDIERDIRGVIKVGQTDEETKYQELSEYVVTNELLKHFRDFFDSYNWGLQNPTDDIGVWISGFFGSGKSHFLKILSYILDTNLTVHGRRPIDFFKEDNKIDDSSILANMENATNYDNDVILFNIDSKSAGEKNILNVFIKVFNEMQGYCGELPFVADFERKLASENKYEIFKQEFEKLYGKSWVDSRDDYYFVLDDLIQAVVNIDFMSESAIRNWADKAEDNQDLSIEKFAKEINEYCKTKDKNYRILFLVDEIGQYIAKNQDLMLNLQTIVEDLGDKCGGKAWVVVTSQQNIDEITEVMERDFSKIQGRFKTRISLSSSNVDEVIRRRILTKNNAAKQTLEAEYPIIESDLKRIIDFDKAAEMKKFTSPEVYSSVYPFIPYQFKLMQDSLTQIRLHSSSGKHLADGERSMLALFKESAIALKNKENGALVPFHIFYEAIEKFIDHTHRNVIEDAKKNDLLEPEDVELLKILFLIKYVKEIKATTKNLTTLMIQHIDEDIIALSKQVSSSLNRLEKQTLIQKNLDEYSFLTNEEQDVNREIMHQTVEDSEISEVIFNFVYSSIYPKSKFGLSNRYNFYFNKAVDNNEKISKHPFGVRTITKNYGFESDFHTAQSSLDDSYNSLDNNLRVLSADKHEVIIKLNNDSNALSLIRESIQIAKFLNKRGNDASEEMVARKQNERNEKLTNVKDFLEESIKNADIYINGNKSDISVKNASDKIDDALSILVSEVYSKIDYMVEAPDKAEIKKVLDSKNQTSWGNEDSNSRNALDDLDNYVLRKSKIREKPSLKSILNRYNLPPYGFTDLDIKWLVAKLFVQKRISLFLNGEELSLLNNNSSQLFDYLIEAKYTDKILLSKREKRPDKTMKIVKNVLKDVYGITFNQDDDDEILMRTFHKANDDKLSEIEDCLREFKILDRYPGHEILIKSKKLFTEIKRNNSLDIFYEFIVNNEDNLLDVAKELDPVLTFFNSPQKDIFKEACETDSEYEANKNLINNAEFKEIACEIKKIIQMPIPYSCISKLTDLKLKFNSILEDILEKERISVKNCIDKDLNLVLEKLDTDSLKNEFEDDFKNRFNNLKFGLDDETNLAIVRGIVDASTNLRNDCLNKISEWDDGGESSVPPKFINIRSFKSGTFKVENDSDIDRIFDEIKNKVKNQLESDRDNYLEF